MCYATGVLWRSRVAGAGSCWSRSLMVTLPGSLDAVLFWRLTVLLLAGGLAARGGSGGVGSLAGAGGGGGGVGAGGIGVAAGSLGKGSVLVVCFWGDRWGLHVTGQ